MSRKQMWGGIIAALCCLLAPAVHVAAVGSGGFGGRPANPDPSNPRTESIFIYTVKGGETKEDQVLVANNSDEKATIALYAVDGVTTNTGSYTCRQKSEARRSIGEWLKLSKDTVTLEPKTNTLVDFTLSMPENADVGEHNGCIVFENAEDSGEAVNGGAIRLRTRQAIRVVATIPGQLYRSIEIANFGAATGANGTQEYALALQNIGNVSADVDTKVTLTDMFGHEVYRNGGGYPVFANQKLDVNFTNSNRPFWGGWFTAKASISYDKRAGTFGTDAKADLITKDAEEVTFFITPSPTALLIIIVPCIVLVVLVVSLFVRRIVRRRTKKVWGTYEVKGGDTLESIASIYSTHWKKLASINGIKAPYGITEGTLLKVPNTAISAPASMRVMTKPVPKSETKDEIDALLDTKPRTTRRQPKEPEHKKTNRQK